jgi:hypothetical protein
MTRYAAIVLALAVFVLAGCSITGTAKQQPPPKTLSHYQLVHGSKRAFKRFARQTKRIHHSGNFFKDERAARTILIPAYEHLLFALHQLQPPPADAKSYRKMLGTLNYLDLTVQQYFNELDLLVANHDRGQLAHAKYLLRRIKRLTKRLKSGKSRVGVTLA